MTYCSRNTLKIITTTQVDWREGAVVDVCDGVLPALGLTNLPPVPSPKMEKVLQSADTSSSLVDYQISVPLSFGGRYV